MYLIEKWRFFSFGSDSTWNNNKVRANFNIRQQQGLLEIICSDKSFTSENSKQNLNLQEKITNPSFPLIFNSSFFREDRSCRRLFSPLLSLEDATTVRVLIGGLGFLALLRSELFYPSLDRRAILEPSREVPGFELYSLVMSR